MITMVEKDGYFCSRLEESDFDVFKSVFTACTAEKEAPDINLTEIIESTDGECLRVFFEDPDIDHFVLLKEQGDDFNIIGEARICYMQGKAELEDSHILKEYRNNGFANYLHSARLEYLAEEKPQIDFATLHIFDWNIASIKAAERNGFKVNTNEPVKNGFIPFFRSLDDLRSRDLDIPEYGL